MSWMTIILLILKYGPVIWEIVKEIIELIKKIKVHMPQTEAQLFSFGARERLEMAIQYYKLTKDKSRLYELHGELTTQLANLEK